MVDISGLKLLRAYKVLLCNNFQTIAFDLLRVKMHWSVPLRTAAWLIRASSEPKKLAARLCASEERDDTADAFFVLANTGLQTVGRLERVVPMNYPELWFWEDNGWTLRWSYKGWYNMSEI
jgi:hypothetical protein